MEETDADPARRFADAVGTPLTLIGLAIVFSTLIYALVMGLIAATQGSVDPSAVTEEETAVLRILAGILLLLTPVALYAAWKLREVLPNHPCWLRGIGSGTLRIAGLPLPGKADAKQPVPGLSDRALQKAGLSPADPRIDKLRTRTGDWYRVSLIALSVAEAPGIFGLVVALIAQFNAGGLLNHPIVLIGAIAMGLASLGAKWVLRPTTETLARFLGGEPTEEALPEPAQPS
jgi:F0F1-type ATP synthase membrane subunit c/vacuolar-type H+-ATPase subunit K